MEKMLLTKSEVCAALGISRSTLEKAMRSGAMPFKKVGKDKYKGPTGKVFNKKQVELYYANGGKFPSRKKGRKK